jgi:phosphate transport system substrate-binding protein
MRLPCLLFTALCLLLAGCQAQPRINAGGSSFIYPLMLKWSRVYAAEKNVQVDYQSTGSGNGIQQMIVGTIDFGCTDAPMSADQLASAKTHAGDVIHIPLVMGGVVPVYNLPGVEGTINFGGPALAGIFLGTITKWNDPAIAETNPGTVLPDQHILVVSRSDPSGTTAIFADYIAKVAPELWKQKEMPKPGTAVRWPAGEAQKGNEGVAGLVQRVPGAISYVELKYAHDLGLKFGAVRNRAGKFVQASPESVTSAAASLKEIPQDLCFSLTDADGEATYPISGTTWAVLYQRHPPACPLVEFLNWAVDPQGGQKYARELHYAPLTPELIEAARQKISTIDDSSISGSLPL